MFVPDRVRAYCGVRGGGGVRCRVGSGEGGESGATKPTAWLGARRVKDQLQQEGSPRRMYNARVRALEWFRFN